MCDARATSQEHIPPKAIFPELKDLGRDLRRNLITVPSCDEHNSQKCKDDEFLHFALLMNKGFNEVGDKQFMTKLLRAARRMPSTYGAFISQNAPVYRGDENLGQAIVIDHERFDLCFGRIARGLFFHHYGIRCPFEYLGILCSNFLKLEGNEASHYLPTLKMCEAMGELMGETPVLGENAEVFKYRVKYDSATNVFAVDSTFYDSVWVCVYASNETQKRRASAG